jgi:multidrug resistance efflux pump
MQPATTTGVPGPEAPATPTVASSMRVVTFSCLALLAGSVATVGLEHARYERLPGFLQAQSHIVYPQREARVARYLVDPGDSVEAGQPILELEDGSIEAQAREQQFTILSLENELARQEAERDARLDQELLQIHDRIFEARFRAAQSQRVPESSPLAITVVANVLPAEADIYPPVVSLPLRGGALFSELCEPEEARGRLQEQRSQNQAICNAEQNLCTERIAQLEQLGRELPDKIRRSMGIDLTLARLEQARARLAEIEAQRSGLTILATHSGRLGLHLKRPGERVSANEPVAQILHEESPYLVLHVPSDRIADFSPGTLVELLFPGGIKGKGRIDAIPPQTLAVPNDGQPLAQTYVAAQIQPVGRLWPDLPFGSIVEVRLHR